jgi:hypothetical protein
MTQPPPLFPCHLSGWAYGRKLSAMLAYLAAGWELSLYHPREYRMVLWYGDYLWGIYRTNLRTAAQHVTADEGYRAQRLRAEKNARKAKRLAADLTLPPYVPVHLLLADAMHELTRGLLWVRYQGPAHSIAV